MTKTKKRPERVMLRVIKGGLAPADRFSQSMLRARGYKVGDIVAGEIRKPRNPGFWRLAHAFATLVSENIDQFAGMQAHAVLKRLQWEGNIGCEELGVNVPGVGMAVVRMPQSMGFESMEDGEFHEVMRAFCNHVSKTYWKDLEPEQIEQMAGCMVDAA